MPNVRGPWLCHGMRAEYLFSSCLGKSQSGSQDYCGLLSSLS